jgi:hypothetical protein
MHISRPCLRVRPCLFTGWQFKDLCYRLRGPVVGVRPSCAGSLHSLACGAMSEAQLVGRVPNEAKPKEKPDNFLHKIMLSGFSPLAQARGSEPDLRAVQYDPLCPVGNHKVRSRQIIPGRSDIL